MNFRKLFLPACLVVSVIALASLPAFANHEGMEQAGKTCPMMAKSGMGGADKGGCAGKTCDHMKGSGCSKGGSSSCPIAAKFIHKAGWLMSNQQELSLTDEQVDQIKALNLDVEKNMIRGMAEMKVMQLDMMSELHQDNIDVAGIESMIDSGMARMSSVAKANLKAYAALKTILTPEQKAKAEALKKAGYAGQHHTA